MASRRLLAHFSIVLLSFIIATSAEALEIESLLQKIEAAYLEVKDYRMLVEVERQTLEGSTEREKFRYFFKKPGKVRIEYEEPHRGTVAVYPDGKGKVAVKLWGMFTLHLSPESSLLRKPSGQRIDQTDLGSLIRNISLSVKENRRGPLRLEVDEDRVKIEVLAEDHFLPGVLTGYEFFIDKSTWLPMEIKEFSGRGSLERTIRFKDLAVNLGLADSLFELDGDQG